MSSKVRVKVKDTWYTVEVDDLDSDPIVAMVDGEPVEISTRNLLAQPEQADSEEELSAEDRPAAAPAASAKSFIAPMPGLILSVAVKVGDQVVTGDEVCVLEAMKMQQSLRADWSGVVSAVHVKPGQQVLDGDPIVDL